MNHGLLVLIITTLIVTLLLNFIVPNLLIQFATDEEKDLRDLGFKGNFMRLMVYNSAYPLSSSIYLFLLVLISLYLGQMIKIKPSVVKSINNV